MNFKNLFLTIILFYFSSYAFAYNGRMCATRVWLKNGWFKEYDVKYTGVDMLSSKATSKEGSTKASSASSSQATTASVDPGIFSGQSTSSTQYSSSFGPCSMTASEQWIKREKFIAFNHANIQFESAAGDGEYLTSLSRLSGCPEIVLARFKHMINNDYDDFFNLNQDPSLFSWLVDVKIDHDPILASTCILN